MLLTGCANYAGIHSNAKPFNDKMLSSPGKPHQNYNICPGNWWTHLHDPQLNQLIDIALENSPTLQIAESRVREAQHVADISNTNLWPAIDARGTIAREHITPNTFFPPPFGNNDYTETYIGLNFKYEFDFWGKNRQALQASLNEERATEADLAEARLVLTTSVAASYLQLQSDLAALEIAQDLLSSEQQLLTIIKTKTRRDIESDIPLTTADTQVQAAKIEVEKLTAQAKISHYQLAALIGKNPLDPELTIKRMAYSKNILPLPKTIPVNLLGKRPDILASRWRVEATSHQVCAAKAKFYPNINLRGFLSLQSWELRKALWWQSQDSLVGAAIDLPIFDAGERKANLGIKYDEYDRAVSSYNQTILTALREVAEQMATLHSLQAQEKTQLASLKMSEKNYYLINARYKHGISDYTRLLQTKNTLLNERNKHIKLQTNKLQSMVGVIKALGGNYIVNEG
jgi:NodT family efflux transporter outer membrane factor (OMF) lipoprotein